MWKSKEYARIPANTYNNQTDMLTAFYAIIQNADRNGYYYPRFKCILLNNIFTMVTPTRAILINADQTIWLDESIVDFSAKWACRHSYDKNGAQSHLEYTNIHTYDAALIII